MNLVEVVLLSVFLLFFAFMFIIAWRGNVYTPPEPYTLEWIRWRSEKEEEEEDE